MTTRTPILGRVFGGVFGAYFIASLIGKDSGKVLEASPTFEGIPVAATLLIHQAQPHFLKAFPGLEVYFVELFN